jgi:hypothetical protein
MGAGWWGLGTGIVAMVAVGMRARAAGRLREYLIWAGIPLAAFPTIFLFPPHTAGRFLLMAAFLVSGLVVLLVVPRFPVLSGRARAKPRWGGAAAWIALWGLVVALVVH